MSALKRQDGFTLIEVLVATTMSLVIFAATLSILVVFTNGATASTERNDAQDRARLTIDLIARQLRNIASPISSPKLIERASAYDLIFQTVNTPSGGTTGNTTGAERVRYCIPSDTSTGTPSDEALYEQTQTWTTSTPPAIPWSTACPDTSQGQGDVVIPYVMNRYGPSGANDAAFTYNDSSTAPSDLTDITTVQMDIFVNPTPTVSQATAQLQSAVYLRNELRAPVASFTDTATGGGGVLLNAGPSYSPDGASLSYNWSCTSTVCPSSSTLSGSSNGLIDWVPGAGTYTVQLTVSDSTGLTDTISQQVTVT
jgi:prepilin-type N-terminal cleavage/methylation domain-containing protein